MTFHDPYSASPVCAEELAELKSQRSLSGESHPCSVGYSNDFEYPGACDTTYPGCGPELYRRRTRPKQPLKVVHIGPSFVCAGVESWLRALVSHSDESRVRFVHNVVTEEYAVDHELLQKIAIPFSFGRDTAVSEAVLEADIVLVWGDIDPKYLKPAGSSAKVIFVAHGVGEWTRRALCICAPAIDHVVAVSRVVEQQVCGGFPTTVILNGVDQRHVASGCDAATMRNRFGFSKDDFVVGFVGRFSPEKNAHLMLEAFGSLGPDSKALLVGWGPLRYQLMDLCNELIPGRFAFASSREFLGDYYQVMNALCMPSAAEGFGLVAAEAMLHGIPVVSTPVGVAHDLFEHRVNGLLSGADEFGINLSLLEQHPEWARGLGQEGRRTAMKYCLASTMAASYQNLFEQLTQQIDLERP